MREIGEIVRDYREIRKRLNRPPHPVKDLGIDLKRKLPKPAPKPFVKVTVFEYTPPTEPQKILFKNIIAATAAIYRIRIRELRSRCRLDSLALPRQVAVYLAFKHTRMSSTAIGLEIDRDHTTALWAKEKILRMLKVDLSLQENIKIIEDRLFDRP